MAPAASTQGLSRVTLIGYRGSGKSTVGSLLASLLGWRFIDADSVLEERLGCTVAACFMRDGEAGFRAHEARSLADILATSDPQVLATGGGVVLSEQNREALRRGGGLLVYLDASVETLQARLAGDQHRPGLTPAGVVAEVAQVLAVRVPLYRGLAAVTLPASEEPTRLAERIARLVHGAR